MKTIAPTRGGTVASARLGGPIGRGFALAQMTACQNRAVELERVTDV
ncbi:hypothetical protein [Pseudooceanicola antarcticus]|nr:hypothetical protein [Pseudooceanicola antarcticus]